MTPTEMYNKYVPDRKPYEKRAEDIASISLPYLIRKDGSTGTKGMENAPAQSFNGRLINNLTAKMGMALLPPSTSSFRLKPDAEALLQLFGGDEDQLAQMYADLSIKTDAINSEVENQQIRSSLFDVIRQLVGVGSVVVEKLSKKGVVIYPLKSFVVRLDSKGNPYEMCINETLSVLPEGLEQKEEKDEYELYTLLVMDKETKSWTMTQEIDGEMIGDEATYKDYDALPFRYFGWTWMIGDDYHRPFAEDYYSDMEQANKLAKLNTEGAVIAAKSLILVNQRGGRTRKSDIVDAPNGEVIDGREEDISAFQFNKNYDFQTSNEREAMIKQELKSAFLDSGSVTRDAERVTAEEIRIQAQQLESSTLAGIYSKMALDWQKWIIHQVMKELKIKFETIDVNVLTGLDALGRSQEAQKQDAFVQRLVAVEMKHWLKESELITRWASFDGINTANLVKTPNEVKQEMAQAQQQAQDQQMAMSGAESAGKAGGEQAIANLQQ